MFEVERVGPGVAGVGLIDRPLGGVPSGLAELAPGADLAGLLESVDPEGLSGHERVVVLQAWSALLAHVQARVHQLMVSVSEAVAVESPWADEEDVFSLASAEVGAALSWTRRAAEFNLGFAVELLDRYPGVWEALDRGLIDLPRARVIIEQTGHLDAELAGRITEAALRHVSGQTTGQLRARIQRLVITVDPDSARKRYEEGVLERRVVSEVNPSGTGNILGLDLPAGEVNAVMRRINRLARAATTSEDDRSMDQIRADILLDLLGARVDSSHTYSQGRDWGVVDIRVDLTTLLELDESPGEIPGWGPVIADIARKTINEQDHTQWRYTITNPVSGQVIHTGTTRRRPTTVQRRRVQARDLTCVFPGCRMPATGSDIDHRHDWVKGGPTQDHNLQPLCRHHHQLKHNGWKVQQTRSGTHTWTSPLGLTYTTGPDPP